MRTQPRVKARLWIPILTIVNFLLFAGAAGAEPMKGSGFGMPFDASADGHRIDWLIHITGVFTLLLFIIMVIWMVWAGLKHREKNEADYDHGNSKKSIRTALIISAVIFFVVDGNLWVNSTIDVNDVFWNYAEASERGEPVRIQVNAHQWAWDARYPGPDGKFNTKDDIVTLNDIRIPVDRPVVFQLAAVDVIHSFYFPNFRVKMDAVPGMINKLWFRPKVIGEYDIACAQHCGVHHYKMKGKLTVLSSEDYEKWAARASELSAAAYEPDNPDKNWGWEWQEL